VDLWLLGPLEVRVEDRPIDLGARKQRAVLAMLALEAGKTVSADRLAEGLWGERSPATASKMVQLYISHLRRALGENGARIVTRGRGYELQLTDGEVDATRASRLIDESRPREALALWRGEPLADLADEPFAAAEIRRLEELRLRATELAIDADLEVGRHAEVIGELDALVGEHPLRERLHAQRMLALYRSGRQAEALEAYRAARTALVEQIGVEPGAELRELHEQILAQDPALGPTKRAARGAGPPPPEATPARSRVLSGPLLIAAALLLAGVVAVGLIRVLGPDGLDGISEDAVGVIDRGSGRITAQYAVGHGPQAVTSGAGSVWVANQLDGTVSRIDRAREQVVTIDVGGEPTGVAFGAGSLWVADGRGRAVTQIAPEVNKVVQRIDVGNAAHAVAAGYGAVWVASAVDATVVRIDARSGRAGRPIAVQARPSALAAGAGSIWVASEGTASVVRLDPRSGAPVASIRVGNGPSAVAVGAGAVWVANRLDGTVSRIDPRSEVAETVRVGRAPRALAADRDGVWVADAGAGRVIRLDRRGRRRTNTVAVGSSPAALAVVGGGVWTATLAPTSAHRGGTLRVGADGSSELIDPHTLSTHVPLAYDGLVAYRRAGGAAGGTLVPDLARELPEPTADGRTYRFRLRSDLRFSNGATLRPEDVRASLERMFVVNTAADGFTGYLPIRGASRCRPKRCDLSDGVEVDAAANAVTIHLSRPDVEFLHKLVNAYVVPAGSPREPVKTRTLPGTGPYKAERWDPLRGGTLVRNPHFRVWTPDRPDGFPDRIVVGVEQDRLPAVDDGAPDVNPVDVQKRGAAQLRTLYGPRLHTDPYANTGFVFLNVRAPPFDDVRVRRALNFAVDRGRVAELLGSSETEQPTCQLLPPGFQGYTPSCPFTLNPNAAGTWTAPDLVRAQRLVAASGTRGMTVEFWSSTDFAPVGRYFRSLLRELGYRSRLRTFPDLHLIIENASPTRPQIGIWGWIADSAGPFNFLKPLVSCGGDVNLSRFCAPRIDAAMERAAAASGPEAIERWRRVEAALAAQAPVVPLSNRKDAAVTSERVGNYQFHTLWGPLLDQLWVR
jgi:ABC-type transport system substrate-binding protein/DNA-binding SARP family transcriptional activator/DNA-binding beta-propeller fold protein YncE